MRVESGTRTWAKDGMRVWYAARPGLTFAGTVDGEAWKLGDGTLVVNLKDMSPQYQDWSGGKAKVRAAAVHRCWPFDSESSR